ADVKWHGRRSPWSLLYFRMLLGRQQDPSLVWCAFFDVGSWSTFDWSQVGAVCLLVRRRASRPLERIPSKVVVLYHHIDRGVSALVMKTSSLSYDHRRRKEKQ
ncbi:unnamed protein product, partial [Ectocarpus sp. 6 AP-2014]